MGLYANVKRDPSDPVRGGNIAYLGTAQTLGWENIEINSADDLRRVIEEREVAMISFHSTVYPRRPVPVEKADKWIRKVGRELEAGRS